MIKLRRKRRADARKNGVEFTPQYNSGVRFDGRGKEVKVGGSPKTYEEMYDVGYERFNNKFVTIKKAEKKMFN